MTMYESAERINKDLINLFNSDEVTNFTVWQQEQILNIIIRFGAVAKFRCRSNAAYKNFLEACFRDIAEVQMVKQSENYEIMKAHFNGLQKYYDFLKKTNKEDTKASFIDFVNEAKENTTMEA